jgi:hypothetical protein
LGVQADWAALARFMGTQELAALQLEPVSQPQPPAQQSASQRVRFRGQIKGQTLQVDWQPDQQLPERIVRHQKDGSVVRITLMQEAPMAPPDWPTPKAQSTDYERLDAADFGDMEYDPVVKKSQALDVRSGWRTLERHQSGVELK